MLAGCSFNSSYTKCLNSVNNVRVHDILTVRNGLYQDCTMDVYNRTLVGFSGYITCKDKSEGYVSIRANEVLQECK